MRIQHNIMAMGAYRNYTNNVSAMKKNLEKLSSGYKINRAGDDAAGLAISEKMRAQITGLETAQKNAKDGISLVQTAEGALTEVHDMLNRMVTLATQSANGTYDNETDRYQLQKELDQLRSEIDRIADSSNFNGIKLLDGSLAKEQVATKIEVGGNAITYKSAGSKATYTAAASYGANDVAFVDGDTFKYTVALENGKSYTVNLTAKVDETTKVVSLVGDDGTSYTITQDNAATPASKAKASTAEIDAAIVSELKKTDLGKDFDITALTGKTDAGKIKLEALEVGTGTPVVRAMDAQWTVAGAKNTTVNIGVNITDGVDAGIEIRADELTEYNGTNYEDAVFTINGHKFVILANDLDTTQASAKNEDYLRAVAGLGKDVHILVGGIGGLMSGDDTTGAPAASPDAANNNYKQNIKLIADVTGLNVGDGIDESANNPTATQVGADPTEGIRLTLSGKATEGKGLRLQIGDTADSYNQLEVSISDCHVKAMGIGDISIADQDSAAAAVDAIKKAINYVSDVRGTLGATQNRLDHTINNLSVMQENIQDAESTIRDTDVAAEMMEYTKNNILIQSAQAMLAQANQVPQGVLQLLQ